MDYAKTFQNDTTDFLVLVVTMRNGENDVTNDGVSFSLSLDANNKFVKVLPDTNYGNMPFLNSVTAISPRYGNVVCRAQSRSDANDNILNTRNALKASSSGNNLVISSYDVKFSHDPSGAVNF